MFNTKNNGANLQSLKDENQKLLNQVSNLQVENLELNN